MADAGVKALHTAALARATSDETAPFAKVQPRFHPANDDYRPVPCHHRMHLGCYLPP